MKKINYIFILPFLFAQSLLAQVDNEETNEEPMYEINLPDVTDLRLPTYAIESEIYALKPKDWSIRAIAINDANYNYVYSYEFDKQANLVSMNGKKQLANGSPIAGYLAELYSRIDNKPVWKGNSIVYYWITQLDDTKSLSNMVYGGAILVQRNDKVCPAQEISGGYVLDLGYNNYNEDTRQFLNGDCNRAIDKEINGRVYKTYPPSKKINLSDNIYWTVQYFSDPITPMYDQNNKCVLYCDVNEKK